MKRLAYRVNPQISSLPRQPAGALRSPEHPQIDHQSTIVAVSISSMLKHSQSEDNLKLSLRQEPMNWQRFATGSDPEAAMNLDVIQGAIIALVSLGGGAGLQTYLSDRRTRLDQRIQFEHDKLLDLQAALGDMAVAAERILFAKRAASSWSDDQHGLPWTDVICAKPTNASANGCAGCECGRRCFGPGDAFCG